MEKKPKSMMPKMGMHQTKPKAKSAPKPAPKPAAKGKGAPRSKGY